MTEDFGVLFADQDDDSLEKKSPGIPWKIIIADDDPGIHEITRLALGTVVFKDRPLQFISAYSGKETIEVLEQYPDSALLLLDVVMESENSGLEVVKQIRNKLQNHYIRIALRTGQPGRAPESEVIVKYDIHYYLDKSELTAKKLFTVTIASLRAYENLIEIGQGMCRAVINSAQVGILISDQKSLKVKNTNPSARKMMGIDENEILGVNINQYFVGGGIKPEKNQYSTEDELRVAGGRDMSVLLSTVPLTVNYSKLLVTTFVDIQERKHLENKLRKMAYYDALTGLPNRVLFRERLEWEIDRVKRHNGNVALLFIDLNDFKKVNDRYGHDVGDGLLKEVATCFISVTRKCDGAARLSGDEFAIILSNPEELTSKSYITNVCRRILASLIKPFRIQGCVCEIGASIGISILPDNSDSLDGLIKSADQAMYKAKGKKASNTLEASYCFVENL